MLLCSLCRLKPQQQWLLSGLRLLRSVREDSPARGWYMRTLSQRTSEARVSLLLKLEGALSGHLDPDVYVRGGKGMNTQQFLTPYPVQGTVRGISQHYLWRGLTLPSARITPPTPQISIWLTPSPPLLRFFSIVPFLVRPVLSTSFKISLESEVIPRGHAVNVWICLARCTFYSALTSLVDILHDTGREGPYLPSSRQEK